MAVVQQAFLFQTGQIPTATQWNANPAAFVAGFANIDNTNIGAAGLYASQVKPTGTGTATFGGSTAYTFPNGAQAPVNAVNAAFPGLFTGAGATTGAAQIITGTTYMGNTLSAGSLTTVAQSLAGSAKFTSVATYMLFVSLSAFSGTPLGTVLYASPTGVSSFNVFAYVGSNTLTFVTVNWVAIGT